MEEIISQTEKIFLSMEAISKSWEAEFEAAEAKLDAIAYRSNEKENIPQSKKRPKRVNRVNSFDSDENVTFEKHDLTAESTVIDEVNSSRPVRAAKLKVENLLKERPINTKLRRPTNNPSDVTIKAEKHSDVFNVTKQVKEKDKISNTTEPVKRKSSELDVNGKETDVDESSKKTDESVEILSNQQLVVVELSDDETDKMPPPATVPVPRKRNLRNKVKDSIKEKESEDPPSIKAEKQSLCNAEKDNSEKTETTISEAAPIKKEKISDVNLPQTKKKKGRPLRHRPIKAELSIDENTENPPQETVDNENTEKEPADKKTIENNTEKNTSAESVYEDALTGNVNKPKLSKSIDSMKSQNAVVLIAKMKTPPVKLIPEPSPEKTHDATFISAKDDVPPVSTQNDATFVTNDDTDPISQPDSDATFVAPAQSTFVLQKDEAANSPNITVTLDKKQTESLPPCNDETFNVNNPKSDKDLTEDNGKNDENCNSLLTDDDSAEEEEEAPPPITNSKQKKALFNPFVGSPVKKRVAAFEKAACASPALPLRTRTRLASKENKELENKNGKHVTPTIGRTLNKFLTPTQQNNTPASGPGKKTPSSSNSKIHVYTKPTSAKVLTRNHPGSRDSSAEDSARGRKKISGKVSENLEEKRKKRELKHQQAIEVREAREKQKLERLKKLAEEKEERARKAMELEKIQKNLKLQEEKREIQKKLERQKQLEREKAEIAKKEREMIELMKIQKAKEALQLRQEQNQQKLIAQKKIQKIVEESKQKFNFDMLNSDDSTDDEDKTSAKRPPPPTWSRAPVRQLCIERQAHLPSKIIDSFFSVQPMTPNLREIFPAIDPRYLKRNSSVVWKTPPRYSQLPKY